MSLIGTPEHRGQTLIVLGVDAPGAGQPTIELDDISKFNEFALMCITGSMTVRVSLDGSNYTTSDLAWEDEQAANPNQTRVTTLLAGGLYRHRGSIKSIRILQSGATGIANAVLMAGTIGRT
jgi:hypothetical protein